MILPPNLTLALGGALLLSLAGNVALGWQWAQAGAECKTAVAVKTNTSVARIAEASVKRDVVSRDITKGSDARTQEVSAKADVAIQIDKGELQDAYVKDTSDASRDVRCTVLRPLPDRVQNVIESATARTNR